MLSEEVIHWWLCSAYNNDNSFYQIDLNIPQSIKPSKGQRSMDKIMTKMMTFCLLLAGNTINHSLIWLLHILENKGKINQLELLSFFFSATSSPVLTGEWEVSVEKSLDALVSSCVVVPCSFTPPRKNIQTSRLRGIWLLSDKENQRIYHEDDSEVMENFRGRTKIGPLIEKNCTLEMTKVKDHDNGPFCFRVEVVEMNKSVSDAFTFHDCVTLTMLCMSPPIFYYLTLFSML